MTAVASIVDRSSTAASSLLRLLVHSIMPRSCMNMVNHRFIMVQDAAQSNGMVTKQLEASAYNIDQDQFGSSPLR